MCDDCGPNFYAIDIFEFINLNELVFTTVVNTDEEIISSQQDQLKIKIDCECNLKRVCIQCGGNIEKLTIPKFIFDIEKSQSKSPTIN